jgi:hypothetical protein
LQADVGGHSEKDQSRQCQCDIERATFQHFDSLYVSQRDMVLATALNCGFATGTHLGKDGKM